MQELSLLPKISLYVLLGLIRLLSLIIWSWQVQVLRGKEMKNPDGSADGKKSVLRKANNHPFLVHRLSLRFAGGIGLLRLDPNSFRPIHGLRGIVVVLVALDQRSQRRTVGKACS